MMGEENLPSHIVRTIDAMKELDIDCRKCLQVLSELIPALPDSTSWSADIEKINQILSLAVEKTMEKQVLSHQLQEYLNEKITVLTASRTFSVEASITDSDNQPGPSASNNSSSGIATNSEAKNKTRGSRGRKPRLDSKTQLKPNSSKPLTIPPTIIAHPETMSSISSKSELKRDPTPSKTIKRPRPHFSERDDDDFKRKPCKKRRLPSPEDDELEESDLDEPKYCFCNESSYGDMIGCDNDLCPLEWFHFKCVGLSAKPRGKWYCPRCRGDRPNIMKPKQVIIQELEQYNREKED